MIVKNNTLNPKGMQVDGKWHTLIPGVNEVEPKVWEAFIANPARRFELNEGLLEVVEELPAEKPLDTLAKLSVKEAIALVKETFRKDLLERWAAEESRKTVLDALEKQLDGVTPVKADPAANPDEDGSEEDAEA